MSAQLSMWQVSKSYEYAGSHVTVFNEVSIDFKQGSSYAIIGASGSGKSTAIHLLAGITEPTSGAIFFNDINTALFSDQQASLFFQHNISLVFQQPSLIAELTVMENVMLKAIIAGTVTQNSYEHARVLLDEVGLLHKADAYPAMLSGGQQQRVSIARAIFVVPQFLLVDEPTGNLDENTSNQIIDLIMNYHTKYGMGVIMSTHNHQIAQRMEYIVQVMDHGLHYINRDVL